MESPWTNIVEWFLADEAYFDGRTVGFCPLMFDSYPHTIRIPETELWDIKYSRKNQRIGNWLFTQNENGTKDTLTLSLPGKGMWVWKLEEELNHGTTGNYVMAKWPD